jgi:hypothetical protein
MQTVQLQIKNQNVKMGFHHVGCRTVMWKKKMAALKHLKSAIILWDLLTILCFVVAWPVHKT